MNEKIIQVNSSNIDEEHICCAFSDKKCREGYLAKKEWLKERFLEGYTFKKLNARGKVFIEYVPSENCWLPIEASNCMVINCFWVSGKFKKQGFGKKLIQECINDSKGKDGIIAVVSKKKQPFMSDKKFLSLQGFEVCDSADPYFEMMFLRINEKAELPKFKSIVKEGKCDNLDGLTAYYSPACPFNEYYVNVELKECCEKRNIPLKVVKIDRKDKAQNHFVPHTLYSIFYNGKFITQHVLNDKNFDKFVK